LTTALSSDDSKPIHLQFDDNRLLPLIYGEHDRNLARIEQLLGVTVSPRGNRLAIAGDGWSAEAARAALGALYARAKQGLEVSLAEVDAAVRLASRAAREGAGGGDLAEFAGGELSIHTRKRVISPRSPTQADYIRALQSHDMVFGLGPAGTGKTYLAVAMGVHMMIGGEIDRLILSRPAVEAGERLGFLPGDIREKVDPYLRPLYDALHDMLPAEQVIKRLDTGEIEIAPLAFMRGRTLSNAFVIVDEAQNTTPMQMKMLLTRLGENARMVVTGDMTQIDLPTGATSGLDEALKVLGGVEGIAFIHFTDADVVRHPLVTRIVRAYDRHEAAAKRKRGGKKKDET
jgi:phosphate starvation-inducible PhoH-like protein